ncbi:MAG: CoA-binding protein [Caldilineales bacterium]|nr:CoA-binding protein [Caldilineales bacterium]
MANLAEMAADFLAQDRIAVAGVTRTKEDAANSIYRKLKTAGHEVFPVNPNAETFDGDPCYPDLGSIPGGVAGVVVVTKPEITEQIVRDCARAGVSRVWIHRSLVGNSVSDEAVRFCEQNGITVIPGGCPNLFCEPVDFGHKCMKWFGRMTGAVPK